jgi:hypothetical protein
LLRKKEHHELWPPESVAACCRSHSRHLEQKRYIMLLLSFQRDLLIKVKPRNKKIRQPSAAHDKQHSNAGQNTARATEGIAKQAQPALAETE